MGNHPSQTPKYGQEYGSRDITADLPDEHKDKPDEPNASQETEDECYHRLRQNEIQILLNWMEALGKKSDTIATVVVENFISTFVDPHSYTQTLMSDDGLKNIADTTAEITRTVEHVDKLSYASELDIDNADNVGGIIQHYLQD